MMDKNDLEDLIIDAQNLIGEAIRLLELYVRETRDAAAEAYIVDHLKIIAGRGHGFLADDMNLDDLLEALDEAEEEPDEKPESSYPKSKISRTGTTLYLLENNNGPILNSFGEPLYVTVPED